MTGLSGRSKARGMSLAEVLAVIMIMAIVGVTFVPQLFDVRGTAKKSKQDYTDGSLVAQLSGASYQNYLRGQAQTAGTRMGKWEYTCLGGNQIAQLLDNRDFEGGYGGMWFRNPDGSPDYSRYWALDGTTTVAHGEMVTCTATRNGVTEPFFLYGCTTWEGCRCNTYPSDCEFF